MEKILKQITNEFKDIKEDNFITLLSLLNLIVNHSNSKINIQLLTKKVSEYKDLENIRCGYTTLGTRDDRHQKDFQKLNESLKLYNILNFIKKALDIESKRNQFLKSDQLQVLDIVEGGYILVNLNSKDIYVLISIILDEFYLLQIQLNELEEKSKTLELYRFNYNTNVVKGYSYQYSVKNFYINKFKKEIIVVEIYTDNRDNYNWDYYEIELDILNKLLLESDEFDFKNVLKQNDIKTEKLNFSNKTS
ncbi:MAG: hypothetical protein B7Y83_02295 [Flavobacteriales bacterium 32-34-25]|nr:MAG: hypothetical protein B7Y83_02295 [Flavobacteriales bacterium 32-34-25]